MMPAGIVAHHQQPAQAGVGVVVAISRSRSERPMPLTIRIQSLEEEEEQDDRRGQVAWRPGTSGRTCRSGGCSSPRAAGASPRGRGSRSGTARRSPWSKPRIDRLEIGDRVVHRRGSLGRFPPGQCAPAAVGHAGVTPPPRAAAPGAAFTARLRVCCRIVTKICPLQGNLYTWTPRRGRSRSRCTTSSRRRSSAAR